MRVIIPTDLSIDSEKAVLNLLGLLKKQGTEVTLFHCVEPTAGGGSLLINVSDILVESAENKLKELQTRLEDIAHGSFKVDFHITFGHFQSQFEVFVKDSKPDLVIIPSSRKTFFERVLIGQRSLSFIGKLSVPTLITPFDYVQSPYVSIGLAVDQEEGIEENTILQLNYLTEQLNAKLQQFHVDDFTEENLDFYLDEKKQAVKDGHVSIVHNVEVESGIKNWIKQTGTTILAMVTHRKDFFHRNFTHSTIRELVKENKLSILVLTEGK